MLFALVKFDTAFKLCIGIKLSGNFILLTNTSSREVAANKSANEGALILIETLFYAALIILNIPFLYKDFLLIRLNSEIGSDSASNASTTETN